MSHSDDINEFSKQCESVQETRPATRSMASITLPAGSYSRVKDNTDDNTGGDDDSDDSDNNMVLLPTSV